MATNEWFEMTDGCIERKNGETIVYDEEGNEMFRLDWEAGINQVVKLKAVFDKAYRVGRVVGQDEKINEMRRVLEIPAGAFRE